MAVPWNVAQLASANVQPLGRDHVADEGRGDDDGQQEADTLKRACSHQPFGAGGGCAQDGGSAEQDQAGAKEPAQAGHFTAHGCGEAAHNAGQLDDAEQQSGLDQ